MKNFIGLTSVVLVGLMTTLAQIQVDYRKIRGFYKCGVVQNIRECQGLCIFNPKFAG